MLLDPNSELINDVKILIKSLYQLKGSQNNRNKERRFTFDFAFDQKVDTTAIFLSTIKNLLPDVITGYNATVFAYGSTGAGKTYT